MSSHTGSPQDRVVEVVYTKMIKAKLDRMAVWYCTPK